MMVENIRSRSMQEGYTTSRLQQFNDYWIQRIKGTSDFLGINHYTTYLVTGPGADPTAKSPSWLKDIGAITSLEVGEDSASEWFRVNFNVSLSATAITAYPFLGNTTYIAFNCYSLFS